MSHPTPVRSLALMMALALAMAAWNPRPAQAQEAEAPQIEAKAPQINEPTTWDYVLMPISGVAGGIVALYPGGLLGFLGCSSAFDRYKNGGGPPETTAWKVCFGTSLGASATGGVMGSMYLYGSLRDLGGSGAGLVLGTLAGFGSFLLLSLALGNDFNDLKALGGLSLAPIGGTLGYMLWRPDTAQGQAHGELLHYDPGAGLSLAVPAVSVSAVDQDTRISVPLLGGRF